VAAYGGGQVQQTGSVTRLIQLTDDQIQSLPIDRLALMVLRHCDEGGEWNTHNFLTNLKQSGTGHAALACLSEAMNWLIAQGLIAHDNPGQSMSPQSIFVTRAGKRVLSEGIAGVSAATRLNVDLHKRLARVRTQFLIGEYELAAFAAMREVEIRVRELAKADNSLVGVKLMRTAFKPEGGPLADPELDAGERVGMMELFAGAIGIFKNPPSHRQVDYDDPTEASEIIMLADLLMRMLDRLQ
jgi:uncharacterized protein (TIGR02391 family)